MVDLIQREPYRLFFPLGILCLLAGLVIWLPQAVQTDAPYPINFHRFLVLNGFIYCFIAGFLMTALPQFTKSHTANRFDLAGVLLLTVIGAIGIYGQTEKGAAIYLAVVTFFQSLILFFFYIGRLIKRQSNPPYLFHFVAVGLGVWLVFGISRFLTPQTSTLFNAYELQREAAINLIILGVGARLIPGILGHNEIVQKQKQLYDRDIPLGQTLPIPLFVALFIFLSSYFFPFSLKFVSSYIQLLFVTIFAFHYWKLYKFPRHNTALTWNLWLGAWLFLIGYAAKGLWAGSGIHGQHIFFIGSYVLIITAIATRVMRAHGGQDAKEENSPILIAIGIMTILSMATRVSAFLLLESYATHLGYAAALLTAAILLWTWKVGPWVLSSGNG